LSVKNLPLRNLIAMVYQQDGGLEGGPDWLRSSRFDIDAAADGTRTGPETRLMVRKLLADRFGLVVHKETRELPIYVLVLVHGDGTLGPRMRPSDEACIAELKALKAGTARRSLPAGGSLPSAEIGELPCGSVASRPNGTMKGRTTTLADVAFGGFGPILGRKVIDKTGLSGYYDFDLDFTPAAPPGPPPNASVPTPGYGRPAPFISASFFTAVQEQLGLDLASQTGPVDRVVIDVVHTPTP
jgi:uncharacterized protein (TIGR03435 family)